MHIVHTACLKRLKTFSHLPQLDCVPIGEGIPVELTLIYTRRWDDCRTQETRNQALDFCFEVQANPNLWVIGGQRRAHYSAMVRITNGDCTSACLFYAQENEIRRFAVLLWPQKTGHLVLPALEVHSLRSSQKQSSDEAPLTQSAISCELDYQNLGETILVVPDLISTTVSLDPRGNGRSWLVESTSRSC